MILRLTLSPGDNVSAARLVNSIWLRVNSILSHAEGDALTLSNIQRKELANGAAAEFVAPNGLSVAWLRNVASNS